MKPKHIICVCLSLIYDPQTVLVYSSKHWMFSNAHHLSLRLLKSNTFKNVERDMKREAKREWWTNGGWSNSQSYSSYPATLNGMRLMATSMKGISSFGSPAFVIPPVISTTRRHPIKPIYFV